MPKVYILQDHLRGGGTERQSIELCKALIASDINATLLIGYPGGALMHSHTLSWARSSNFSQSQGAGTA